MSGSQRSRRHFLATSLSAGSLFLAGCNSSRISGEQAPINSTNTATEETTNTTATQPSDSPFDPRSLPQSVQSDVLLDELYGTISFDQNHPYFFRKIPPEDASIPDNRCLVLEYDVTADLGLISDSQLDVRLIQEFEKDAYTVAAKDERTCLNVAGHTLHCVNNDEVDQFESSFDSDAFAVHVDDRQYKRVLLPPDRYWLVFDATDLWGGEEARSPEIQETDLDIAVRVMRDPLDTAERESITTINNIAADMAGNQCERLAEINALTSDICSLDGAEALSRESIETFKRDITAIQQYSTLFHDLLNLLNTRYDIALPTDIASRLETLVEWGSSLLPLIGALINLCADACELGTITCKSTVDTAERRVKNFLVSLFSFVAEIVLLALGLSGKVAGSVVELADEFVLWYIKELAGFRVYAMILKQASIIVDESVGEALGYLLDWTRRVWTDDEDSDTIDSLDLETLANINQDNIHDWRQWDQLLSDRACGAVIASGPLGRN